MTETLRLHYAPDNASLIVRLVLDELSIPFETALVDRSTNAQEGAAYRAINPAGLIPALETQDGPIFETGAILLWIAETYAEMAPPPGTSERATFLKWLFYLSNTTHANLRLNFYPEKYVGADPADHAKLRDHARRNIRRGFDLMNTLATEGYDWFGAESPALLDIYVCAMLRWSALYPAGDTDWFDLNDWPNLRDIASRFEQRPSVDALRRAEGMGPCPFTRPDYPNPPEGVAI